MGSVAFRGGRCVELSRSRSAKRIICSQGTSSTASAHAAELALEVRVPERA